MVLMIWGQTAFVDLFSGFKNFLWICSVLGGRVLFNFSFRQCRCMFLLRVGYKQTAQGCRAQCPNSIRNDSILSRKKG